MIYDTIASPLSHRDIGQECDDNLDIIKDEE